MAVYPLTNGFNLSSKPRLSNAELVAHHYFMISRAQNTAQKAIVSIQENRLDIEDSVSILCSPGNVSYGSPSGVQQPISMVSDVVNYFLRAICHLGIDAGAFSCVLWIAWKRLL